MKPKLRGKLILPAVVVLSTAGLWAIVNAQPPAPPRGRISSSGGELGSPDQETPAAVGAGLPGRSPSNARPAQEPSAGQPAANAANFENGRPAATEANLARQSSLLLARYAQSDANERPQLKTKLRESLGQEFDQQQRAREHEISLIEERLKKLRDQLNKRAQARETIVGRRLEQLLDDADGIGWGGPATDVREPNFAPVGAPVGF